MDSNRAPEHGPATDGKHTRTLGKFRFDLPASLVISLLMHGALLIALAGEPISARSTGVVARRIEAMLVTPQVIVATPPPGVATDRPPVLAEPPLATPPVAPPGGDEPAADGPIVPPQLIGDPDFSEIEKIRVPVPIRVVLRISVSAQGLAEEVSVVEADPLPTATLELVRKAFLNARYTPARSSEGNRGAELEITVNLQPAGPFAPLPTAGTGH